MTLVSQRVMTDLSSLISPWLQVETLPTTTEKTLLESLDNVLDHISQIAQEKLLGQISFIFPIEWKDFSLVLHEKQWKPSLVGLELLLADLSHHRQIFPPQITEKSPPVSNIFKLLEEQAIYHAHHYPDFYQSTQHMPWKEYLQEIQYDLQNPQAFSVFWREEAQIVGMILGEKIDQTAHMYDFVVLKNFRGKGIGEKLLSAFAHKASQEKITQIHTETWWDQPSLRLYSRQGYSPITQEFYKTVSF